MLIIFGMFPKSLNPGHESDFEAYTPSAHSTDSEEVLQLARFWLNRCLGPEHPGCPNESFNGIDQSYPTRLIELPAYDNHEKAFSFFSNESKGDQSKEKNVRLRITKDCKIQSFQPIDRTNRAVNQDSETIIKDEESPRGRYVTLSHCWGKAEFKKLTKENLEDFKKGIPLSSLPPTFRQAIHFARRLSQSIRYIWIDSLCIIQDDVDDWNYESVQMCNVYRNSFCNLSATAASDSAQNMHYSRDPHHLWEDEINLNTEGIPRPLNKRTSKPYLGLQPIIHRCKIQDASFWDRQVEDAPINRRAWVLQERLLAPRVLHFCKDQIAWECPHIEAAESHPYGVSQMGLRAGTVGERKRLKTLVPGEYGPKMLAIRSAENSNAAHEDWKSIVERYTRTSLTKSSDKLIALAGIAELTSKRIGGKLKYVAGMWEKYLASQLLWQVELKYEDERFKYPQRRPAYWNAPTFSWAAVDAPQGIKCAETLQEDRLHISIQNIYVKPELFKFGAIAPGCYIDLQCSLIEVKIGKGLGPVNETNSHDAEEGAVLYSWRIKGQDARSAIPNLYLDSPYDDFKTIQKKGNTFCIPAYRKPKGKLICLMVQLCKEGLPNEYRRIGIADVPTYWEFVDSAHRMETVIRLV